MASRHDNFWLPVCIGFLVLLLSACEGGISGTGDGSEPEAQSSVEAPDIIPRQFLPDTLAPQIPGPLLSPLSDTLIPEQDTAVSALGTRLSQMTLFHLDLRYDLRLLDGLFSQIESACSGYQEGEVCEIPDGNIQGVVSEAQAQQWFEMQAGYLYQVLDAGPALEAAIADKQQQAQNRRNGLVLLSGIQFVSLGGAPYSDELTVTIDENHQQRTLQVRWHRSGAPVLVTGTYRQQGQDIAIQTLFEAPADGDQSTVRYSKTSSRSNEIFVATLKTQPDLGEGLLATVDWSGRASTLQQVYHWDSLANDQGGYLQAVTTSDPGVDNADRFTRGNFDARGVPVGLEHCNENGVDARCDDDTLWTSDDSGSDVATPGPGDATINDSVLSATDLSRRESSASFNSLSVVGVPATVRQVVVVAEQARPPFQPEDIVCSGHGEGAGTRHLKCWVDVSELLPSPGIYSEVLTETGIEYQPIPTAQIGR